MNETVSELGAFKEIELKAVLSKNDYDRLSKELTSQYEVWNEDVIFTTRYRPGDVRLRHSEKVCELVSKSGTPLSLVRDETVIPFPSVSHLQAMASVLEQSGFRADPSWTKHKKEFLVKHNGRQYVLCLQDIKDFAYLLEIEAYQPTDDLCVHQKEVHEIAKSLGVTPVNNSFRDKIKQYIQKH